MNFQDNNGQLITKKIQKILKEHNLWSIRGLNLKYIKSKYFNCQLVTECKIWVKRYKCDLSKVPEENSGFINYSKNQKCDICILQEECCQCMIKK